MSKTLDDKLVDSITDKDIEEALADMSDDEVEELANSDEIDESAFIERNKPASSNAGKAMARGMKMPEPYPKRTPEEKAANIAKRRAAERAATLNKEDENLELEDEIIEDENIDEETEAAKTLKPQSKSGQMAKVVGQMAVMNDTEMTRFFDSVMAQFKDNKGAQGGEGLAAKNKASTAAKKATASAIKEDLEIVFGEGSELSEEAQEKIETLFEAALQTRMEAFTTDLHEEYLEMLDEQVEEVTQTLTSQINDYLTYVAEEWVSENQLQLEEGLRQEKAHAFIHDLTELFENHGFDIPEGDEDIVAELGDVCEDLDEQLNDAKKELIEHSKYIKDLEKQIMINESLQGVSLVKRAKIESLIEDIDYSEPREFQRKVETIIENYSKSSNKMIELNEEEIGYEDESETPVIASADPTVNRYAQVLTKPK